MQPVERLENQLSLIVRYPAPFVGHLDNPVPLDGNGYGAPSAAILDGILDQIDGRPPECAHIADHDHFPIGCFEGELVAGGNGERCKIGHNRFAKRDQIERAERFAVAAHSLQFEQLLCHRRNAARIGKKPHAQRAGCLCLDPGLQYGDRRSELMRCVENEPPMPLIPLVETSQDSIDRVHEGSHLCGQSCVRQPIAPLIDVDLLGLAGNGRDAGERPPHHPWDRDHGNECEQRQNRKYHEI